jgi:N-acetylglutamate synthase-like GNAT family acetyltransferase
VASAARHRFGFAARKPARSKAPSPLRSAGALQIGLDLLSLDYTIRKARLDDRDAIQELIAASARGLSRTDYSNQQIESAISDVFGVDTSLIADGTYFVAEHDGQLAGCGGWSKRRTLFGGDQFAGRDTTQLDPRSEPAKIRAFFVHPQWARKGIAQAILSRCEAEARAAGFRSLELMATLPGVRFYAACGYQESPPFNYGMASGGTLPLVPMRKELA